MVSNLPEQVISALGGTVATARLCRVTKGAVSQWRRNGIPPARELYLRAIRPDVFRSKLNPQSNTNHVTLADAMKMQHLTGRRDIVMAMADYLGGAFIQLSEIQDNDLSHAIRKAVAQFGSYMQEVDSALDDRRITRNEAKCLADSMLELVARASHLQAMLQAMADK